MRSLIRKVASDCFGVEINVNEIATRMCFPGSAECVDVT